MGAPSPCWARSASWLTIPATLHKLTRWPGRFPSPPGMATGAGTHARTSTPTSPSEICRSEPALRGRACATRSQQYEHVAAPASRHTLEGDLLAHEVDGCHRSPSRQPGLGLHVPSFVIRPPGAVRASGPWEATDELIDPGEAEGHGSCCRVLEMIA